MADTATDPAGPRTIAPGRGTSRARALAYRSGVAGAIVLIALVALALVPSVTRELGPAEVSAAAHLGRSETVIRIPPLGEISAHTHATPLAVQLELERVDLEELGRLVTSAAGRTRLRQEVEEDLQGLARRAALQLLAGAAGVGALLGMIFFPRRWRLAAMAAAGAFAATAVLLLLTAATYDPRRFGEPRYSGSLTRARHVIAAVREQAGLLDEARSRYRVAAQRVSQLLVLLGQPQPDPATAATVLLHVSDIHANPLAFDIIRQLAREFEVDAVVDTGDLASSSLDTGELFSLASPLEAVLTGEIQKIGAPYLFVAGNHDPPQLLRRLARVPNVRLLHRRAIEIDEVRIVGWDDPTYSTRAVASEEKDAARLAMASEVGSDAIALRSDVLAVHDVRLASASFGAVPVVLAGHEHERGLEVVAGTAVLTVGSTGATGLKSLTVESEKDYEAQLVYLDGSRLVAVDYITFAGVNGDFVIERRTFPPRGIRTSTLDGRPPGDRLHRGGQPPPPGAARRG